MKRPGILLVLFLLCFLIGCGEKEITDKESIEIKKGGKIVETVRESFEEEYYDEKELKEFIKAEIDTYNSSFDEDRIKLDSCGVKSSIAEVTMTYSSMDDYISFNDMKIFVGELSDIIGTEYHGYVDLTDSGGTTVPLSDVIASGDSYNVVVISQNCDVKVNGKIIYASSGVEILSNKTADVTVSDEAYAYIIYK